MHNIHVHMNKPRSVAAKNPAPSERERVSLVLPAALKAALAQLARAEVRTLNQQCELLLKRGLQDQGVQV
jgi:hypothetical protein